MFFNKLSTSGFKNSCLYWLFAKFLEELLANKRKLEEVLMVTLSEECSEILTNKLLKKEKNPGDL